MLFMSPQVAFLGEAKVCQSACFVKHLGPQHAALCFGAGSHQREEHRK